MKLHEQCNSLVPVAFLLLTGVAADPCHANSRARSLHVLKVSSPSRSCRMMLYHDGIAYGNELPLLHSLLAKLRGGGSGGGYDSSAQNGKTNKKQKSARTVDERGDFDSASEEECEDVHEIETYSLDGSDDCADDEEDLEEEGSEMDIGGLENNDEVGNIGEDLSEISAEGVESLKGKHCTSDVSLKQGYHSIHSVDAWDKDENIDKFVDALEDGRNMTSPATVNTDGESSSAIIDRMDLADAYDEEDQEMLLDEERDQGSPALVAGDNTDPNANENNNPPTAHDVLPGCGTHDDDAVVGEGIAKTTIQDVLPTESVNDGATAITKEMEKVLILKLEWKKQEVQSMRPDIAAAVVYKHLMRPQAGMPSTWYTSGSTPSITSRNQLLVCNILIPHLFASYAPKKGGVGEWRDIELSSITYSLRGDFLLPTKEHPLAPAEEAPSVSSPEKETTMEDAPAVNNQLAHSVKSYSQSVEDDPDQSWLDKVITKIEKSVKAFLTREL